MVLKNKVNGSHKRLPPTYFVCYAALRKPSATLFGGDLKNEISLSIAFLIITSTLSVESTTKFLAESSTSIILSTKEACLSLT